MTGRTCPVHGEYSASGVCRWCEPEPTAGRSREWRLDAVPSSTGYETTFTLLEKTQEAYVWRLEWTEARLKAARLSYDVLMLKHWHSELALVEESRLLADHAALRWERVARRWAAKGPPPRKHRETVDGELAFDDHCASCVRLAREGRWP